MAGDNADVFTADNADVFAADNADVLAADTTDVLAADKYVADGKAARPGEKRREVLPGGQKRGGRSYRGASVKVMDFGEFEWGWVL